MSTPSRCNLETFQRITGALCVAALFASIGAGLIDSDDHSLLVAAALILWTVLFTAWMIVRSINHRRRLNLLAEILSSVSNDEDKPPNGDKDHSS